MSLQRWSNIVHLVSDCRTDLCGIQEYDPGFPLPEAATTALHNDYKCYAAPGMGPRMAFLAKNTLVSHKLGVIHSPRGLAAALRLRLPNGPQRTIVCVYSKFTPRDKTEVDQFIHSTTPTI